MATAIAPRMADVYQPDAQKAVPNRDVAAFSDCQPTLPALGLAGHSQQPRKENDMARRTAQARTGDFEQSLDNQASSEQRAPSHGAESQQGTEERLRLAREKLTHMEE